MLRYSSAMVRFGGRLDAIATVAEQLDSIPQLGGDQPYRIASVLTTSGRNAVAHVLSDEPLSDPSPISDYLALIEEHWRWLDEAEADRRAEPPTPER